MIPFALNARVDMDMPIEFGEEERTMNQDVEPHPAKIVKTKSR